MLNEEQQAKLDEAAERSAIKVTVVDKERKETNFLTRKAIKARAERQNYEDVNVIMPNGETFEVRVIKKDRFQLIMELKNSKLLELAQYQGLSDEEFAALGLEKRLEYLFHDVDEQSRILVEDVLIPNITMEPSDDEDSVWIMQLESDYREAALQAYYTINSLGVTNREEDETELDRFPGTDTE